MRTVFEHGKVYAGNGRFLDAFAIEDGRFVATGTDAELAGFQADTRIDLDGCFVSPGFNDSHMHLLGFGKTLAGADLSSHTGSLQDMIDCLRLYNLSHPVNGAGWLQGRGFNQDYFRDVARMPDRHDLDRVSSDVPILIMRTCGHCCVVNTRGLELAGITTGKQAPEGGAIGMENGEPDGRLFDNAIDLVTRILPRPDKADIMEMIRQAMRAANQYGITSVHSDDYCVYRNIPFETVNEAYRMLETNNELSLRVCEQCNFTEPEMLELFLKQGYRTGTGSRRFRIGPLKLLGDGALGSRTAHLTMPYLSNQNERGFCLFSDDTMNEMIDIAHRNGMQIAVHAIGDACLDQVLTAFERALSVYPRMDHRHGIVHCQITREDQLRRIRALGLHVYVQSVFLDYDNHIVERIVPPELAASSYHWKTLLNMGVCVSNGSDCPVEQPDVMKGIECAVTRTSLDGTGPYLPDEAFTVREALDSFTSEGAKASFEEHVKGQIQPGMLADFVILERDPFEVPAQLLHTIRVMKTYLGGELVYDA